MNRNKIAAAIAMLNAAAAIALGAGSAQAAVPTHEATALKCAVCYWQEYSDGWGHLYPEWVCF